MEGYGLSWIAGMGFADNHLLLWIVTEDIPPADQKVGR